MDWNIEIFTFQRASRCGKSLCEKRCHQHSGIQLVSRQLIPVEIDTDLFLLYAVTAQIWNRLNTTEAVFQWFQIILQFTICFIFRFKRNQQSGGITEVVVRNDSQDTRRQLRFEVLQTQLNLRPDFVLIVHFIVQFHHDIHHSVTRHGICFLLLYLLKSIKIAFQRLCQLFLHLGRSRPGINTHDNPLADGKFRKLLFRHIYQAINSQTDQDGQHQ